jgi:uncharacterized damage-inducible protein DinB
MSTTEFFTGKWENEQPAFVRVLKALPEEKLSYRPHERSTSAADLAWQLVEEQRVLSDLADTGTINWSVREKPTTVAEMVGEYEKGTEALRSRLKAMDEARWTGPGRFLMGGKEVWAAPVSELFWGFLLDMVHHRGQLSTYIRPMGGKVPSIYGPSADDTGS